MAEINNIESRYLPVDDNPKAGKKNSYCSSHIVPEYLGALFRIAPYSARNPSAYFGLSVGAWPPSFI